MVPVSRVQMPQWKQLPFQYYNTGELKTADKQTNMCHIYLANL